LLIVGGRDEVVIELNEKERAQMRCEVKLEIVPGAAHLFEEPDALEQVAQLASDWLLITSAVLWNKLPPTLIANVIAAIHTQTFAASTRS